MGVLLLFRLAQVAVYPVLVQHKPDWAWSNNDGYDTIAVNWVSTGLYAMEPGIPTAARLPLYPAIIAILYGMAGPAYPTMVMVLQALLSTVTGWVLFRLTQGLFGKRSACIALVLFILHPQVNNFIFRCATETLFIFLVTMLAYRSVEYVKRHRLRDLMEASAWLALSLLTRQTLAPLALFAVPLLLLWGMHSLRELKTRLCHTAAAIATVALMVAPWIGRNYLRSGYIPTLQTWVGQPLYQGITVSSRLSEFMLRKKSVSDLDQEALADLRDASRSFPVRHEIDSRPVAREVVADLHARSLAYRRIAERPAAFALEFPRNLLLAPVLQMTWGSTMVLMLWNWPLLVLCVLGVLLSFATRRQAFVEALPVTAIFGYVLVVHALIWPQARYVLPALVPFLSFAAFGLAWISCRLGATADDPVA